MQKTFLFFFTCLIAFLPLQGNAGDMPGLFSNMKSKMAYSGQRQAVLSKNIANANTPNYRAQELKPFKKRGMSSQGRLRMRATNPNHFSGNKSGNAKFKTVEQKNTFETTIAGNNVSLDEEMRKVAENNLEYQATTNLYKKWAGVLRSAINGGRQ